MSRVLLQGRPCAPVFLAASKAKASAASGSDWQCIGEPRLEVLAAKSLKTGVGCCYSVRRSGLKLYCGRWRSQALAAVSLSGGCFVPTRRGFPASCNPGVAVIVGDPDRAGPKLDDRRTFAFGAQALEMAD